jgi:hypothetical protein
MQVLTLSLDLSSTPFRGTVPRGLEPNGKLFMPSAPLL